VSRIPPQLKIKPEPVLTKNGWWQSFQQTYQQVAKTVNNNIEFGNPQSGAGNIKGQWGKVAGSTTIVTPGAPNTDFVVTHNLGQPAVGVDVKSKNMAVDVYTSPSANPSPNTQIILRASAASATITLFIH
jgi:hypothetical protein